MVFQLITLIIGLKALHEILNSVLTYRHRDPLLDFKCPLSSFTDVFVPVTHIERSGSVLMSFLVVPLALITALGNVTFSFAFRNFCYFELILAFPFHSR